MQNVLRNDVKKNANKIATDVSYSNTALTHWFFIEGIDVAKIEDLKQHLWNANLGNGDEHLYDFCGKKIQLGYETTDSYEYSEDFAYGLIAKLSDSVKEFMAKAV